MYILFHNNNNPTQCLENNYSTHQLIMSILDQQQYYYVQHIHSGKKK